VIYVPTVIYRGGTSKAIFLKENDLPPDPELRDSYIRAIFGSPDKRQIDGLGGADPLTSKLAIIGPPTRPDADVDYTFAQVDIMTPSVNYGGVCGNISAAVGPYAIDEGFVRADGSLTRVRIHSTNIGRIIEALVPTEENRVKVGGDFAIDGVPGTGAEIELNWADSVGANTGSLLPTGNAQDKIDVAGFGAVTVSIVDVGNVGVFIKASELGLKGAEGPDEVDSNADLLDLCEAIAQAAGQKIGRLAFLTFVSPAQNYTNYVTGQEVESTSVDYLVRMIFMGQMHKAYAASQTNCCGVAAVTPGTVVNEVTSADLAAKGVVRMGHPSGMADLNITAEVSGDQVRITSIAVYRTARRLMEGRALIKREAL